MYSPFLQKRQLAVLDYIIIDLGKKSKSVKFVQDHAYNLRSTIAALYNHSYTIASFFKNIARTKHYNLHSITNIITFRVLYASIYIIIHLIASFFKNVALTK